MKAIISTFFCLFISLMAFSQPFGDLNIFAETDGEYIVVKITPVNTTVPANSNLTNLLFTLSWPSSYGVDLDLNTIASSIGILNSGPKGTIGTNDIRSFAITAGTIVGPWGAGTEILRVKTTLNSTTALIGDFNVMEYEPNAPINAGAPGNIDPTPFIEFSAVNQYVMDVTSAAIAVPLPIELKNFDVVAAKEAIDLRWVTASEENFRGFDVERSLDAKKYEKIAYVAGKYAKGGAYNLSDRNVSKGTRYYYRLKVINTDGTSEYSSVRNAIIQNTANTSVAIYPNPSNGNVNLDFSLEEDTNTIIDLFDMSGKNVFRKEVEAKKDRNVVSLELMDLPSGVYTVRMNMAGKVVTKLVKISKQ